MVVDLTGKYANTLTLLGRFIIPYRRTLVGAGVALVLTALVTLSIGQGVRMLIDDGFLAASSAHLNRAIGLILFLTLIMAAGTFVRFYLVSWLGERVSADIRMAVFEHLITLHPSYFETNRSGEIMSRLTTDTTLLQSIVGSSLSMALRSVLTFIGALIMLLVTNIKLTMIVLIAVPLVLAPILIFGRRVRNLARQTQDSVADVGTYAGEAIQHIKTVQSYTREIQEKAAFEKEVEAAFEIGRNRVRQRAMLIAVVIFLVFGAITGMFWVGGNDVLNGSITAGELGAFIFYAILVATSVATLSEVFGELQRALGSTERLMELLQVRSLIEKPEKSVDAGKLKAELSMEAVDFYYPSRPNQPALTDLSLRIRQGQSLALVGPSGAGKSTVFELLLRFYDPQKGRIRFDKTDIRNLDPVQLRQQIALVPQQPALFSANVWHNIRYGNPYASDEDVVAAAKAAHAHDFISKLPDGYASYLGDKGVRLSGGQRQRIAIARAILKDPKILLLDEATSALDSESELQVQKALEKLMHNRTTVIIAHRLSTILNADEIVVLDQGRMVARGDHSSLMDSSDLYRRLAKLQFDAGAELIVESTRYI
ncbi:ABC transporter transmembrane domain-containing protein [Motiliproteus sp. MSK22-1]|uniref:ABC transporter transmembrane domain-containing protein n=1 Tax=Motiliproteus sp. MSK22-1 TaxID=1897630 RepID=UPI000978C9DA|nr:ABC transporter transmembrane domain-containing protein [Motiliproteus sp. MSK22-1]OMH32814.1 ABC transporter ATP-binding protein [Motiliproteus sp. MSK22-1]